MTHRHRSALRGARRATLLGLGLWCATSAPTAQEAASPADRLVVRGVQLSAQEGAPLSSILIEDGRIVATGAAELSAPGARVIEGEGYLVVPAFVDAFATEAVATLAPVAEQDLPVDTGSDLRIEMRQANRKGIQPAFDAAGSLQAEEAGSEPWRKSGFGTLLAAPSGELLSGQSCVATTREAAARDRVVEAGVFAHAAFRASGSGYPSTLMGYHSQLRQFFWDAGRHAELVRRDGEGRPGPRPPYDLELTAGVGVLRGEQRLVCEAQTDRDVERWIRLADELGFQIAIAGGRSIGSAAEVLAARGIPVILTLDWDEAPEEVDEEAEADEDASPWIYHEPLGVRRERRARWEREQRDTALRLAEAGVTLAFGTGRNKPKDLLKNVRTLVEAGFPPQTARAALTRGAAELLGVQHRVGHVRPGMDATFALWTQDPLDGDAQLAWLFVDGIAHEFEVKDRSAAGAGPAEGVDYSGTWEVAVTDGEGETDEGTLELDMDDDGELSGTFTMPAPFGDETLETRVSGEVSGETARMTGTINIEDISIQVVIEVTLGGDTFTGDAVMQTPWGDQEGSIEGSREPGSAHELHESGTEGAYFDDGHNHGHPHGHPNAQQEQVR